MNGEKNQQRREYKFKDIITASNPKGAIGPLYQIGYNYWFFKLYMFNEA